MKFNLTSIKRLVLLVGVMLFFIPQSLVAQKQKPQNLRLYDEQPYHFGFIVALNRMSYSIDYKEDYQNILFQFTDHPNLPSDYNPVTVDRVSGETGYVFDDETLLFYNRCLEGLPSVGFTVGVVGNLRLGKYFDLRLIPSLSFGTKVITYQYSVIKNEDFQNPKYFTESSSVLTTIMEFPLHVKYRSKRYNNTAAYIIAGGNPKIDFSFIYNHDKHRIQAKAFDFAAEIGAGFDFYTGYFKMGVEAKMSFGLLNVLNQKNNQFDASINGLKNNMFQLSLTFE